MTTIEEHNAFIDMLAALPPSQAVSVLACGLAATDGRSSPNAEDRRLAVIALQHLDEMRIHDTDELARAEAAADDFFARLDGESVVACRYD